MLCFVRSFGVFIEFVETIFAACGVLNKKNSDKLQVCKKYVNVGSGWWMCEVSVSASATLGLSQASNVHNHDAVFTFVKKGASIRGRELSTSAIYGAPCMIRWRGDR